MDAPPLARTNLVTQCCHSVGLQKNVPIVRARRYRPQKFSGWQSEGQTDDHYACVRKCTRRADEPLLQVMLRRSACRYRGPVDESRRAACADTAKASTGRDNKKQAGIKGAGPRSFSFPRLRAWPESLVAAFAEAQPTCRASALSAPSEARSEPPCAEPYAELSLGTAVSDLSLPDLSGHGG
jgi:hypothetical protein